MKNGRRGETFYGGHGCGLQPYVQIARCCVKRSLTRLHLRRITRNLESENFLDREADAFGETYEIGRRKTRKPTRLVTLQATRSERSFSYRGEATRKNANIRPFWPIAFSISAAQFVYDYLPVLRFRNSLDRLYDHHSQVTIVICMRISLIKCG